MTTRAPQATQDEPSLVQAALRGDGLAYRALVSPHLPMLLRVCARACGNAALAEDAVQEALLVAYTKLPSLHPGVTFRAFLAGIAVKRAKTLLRGEKRRGVRERAALAPQASADSPSAQLEVDELRGLLADALARLPRKRRMALVMRLDAGLSYGEIAAALHSSETSVRVLVYLGLRQLQEALEARGIDLGLVVHDSDGAQRAPIAVDTTGARRAERADAGVTKQVRER